MPEPSAEDLIRIRVALQEGNFIKAIKILRECTGLGLAEAKDALTNFERNPETARFTPRPSGPVRPDTAAGVQEALAAGNKMEAIKRYRRITGGGMKEAREAVEQIISKQRDLNQPHLNQPDLPQTVQVKSGCLSALAAVAVPAGAGLAWCIAG